MFIIENTCCIFILVIFLWVFGENNVHLYHTKKILGESKVVCRFDGPWGELVYETGG